MLVSSLITFLKLLATFSVSFLLIRFGRKPILEIGTLALGLACGMISIGFWIQSDHSEVSQSLIIIALFLFMAIYGASIGPVVWLYIA